MTKTNVMRLLDQAKLAYRATEYDYEEATKAGNHAAKMLGMEEEQVFKTLVARGDKTGPVVFCIPVCFELDLKKAAKASGNKKVEMLPQRELLPLTGYIHGGCSPIGMKKQFATFIDETAQLQDEIAVSAGQRGVQVILSPEILCNYIAAEFQDLT